MTDTQHCVGRVLSGRPFRRVTHFVPHLRVMRWNPAVVASGREVHMTRSLVLALLCIGPLVAIGDTPLVNPAQIPHPALKCPPLPQTANQPCPAGAASCVQQTQTIHRPGCPDVIQIIHTSTPTSCKSGYYGTSCLPCPSYCVGANACGVCSDSMNGTGQCKSFNSNPCPPK